MDQDELSRCLVRVGALGVDDAIDFHSLHTARWVMACADPGKHFVRFGSLIRRVG